MLRQQILLRQSAICMQRRVFVQIPTNQPSGGVKVANQLVNLFREHNFESYIVLPQEDYQAHWLIHPAPTINIARMKELCGYEDIVIDNWPDKDTMKEARELKATTKIVYCQGCTFLKSNTLVGDAFLTTDFGYTDIWVVSTDSLNYLKRTYPRIRNWHLIHPYFDLESIHNIAADIQRENKVLCLTRKGRSYIHLTQLMLSPRIPFDVVHRQFTEKEFYAMCASSKFFLNTAIGIDDYHSFKNLVKVFLNMIHRKKRHTFLKPLVPPGHKEGFPLPPAEAAIAGSIVIGFAMGGGLEWMNPSTCFLAEDRSYSSLVQSFSEALSASDTQLATMRQAAIASIGKFDKEHTWRQIETFLQQK